MRIILASASPQRKHLLLGLGVSFDVQPSAVKESECIERDPLKRAQVLSALKAKEVARHHSGHIVIGCDTLVVSHDGKLLEKPENQEQARAMITLQSGTTSIVHSAVTVIGKDGKQFSGVNSSSVTFKKLSEKEIAWWLTTRLWEDRSGGFQIDGPGQLIISEIRGDWTGVVGLPLFLLNELMAKAGCPLLQGG